MDLMIDQEFADKIPPLTKEEFEQLEINILADGVVINPLIVWNGVIVDGHNRYRILQMHPEIPYQTHEKEFTDRYEAIAWICKNQLGRRKLNMPTHCYFEKVRGLAEPSMVSLEQIKTIDKCRVEKYLGKMTREQMMKVEDAIRESLGMEIPECVEAP